MQHTQFFTVVFVAVVANLFYGPLKTCWLDRPPNVEHSLGSAVLSQPVWAASRGCGASIVPALVLESLTHDADLIVAAEVTKVRELEPATVQISGQSTPARHLVAELGVHRVIKGQSDQPNLLFDFFLPRVGPAYQDIVVGQFGLFFLRARQRREYTVLEPYYPFVVAAPDAPLMAGNEFDRVVGEVAFVLRSAKTSIEQRRQAIIVLGTLKRPDVTAALRRASRETDLELRLEAVGALLARNDISRLDLAEDVLLHLPKAAENVMQKLAFALRKVRDPKAIPSLTRLLIGGDVQTRRSAATALRNIESEDTIEPLSRALEDRDREVRYQAVMGLDAMTGEAKWGPAIDRYKANEEYYLAHWREWVRTRRKK